MDGTNFVVIVNTAQDRFSVVDITDEHDNQVVAAAHDSKELQEKKAEFGLYPISKEDISKLFSGRNLVFIATLSEDNSPHVTPV